MDTPPEALPKSEDNKFSPAQIENWRKVLYGMFGSYAYIMSENDIQKFRDNMSSHFADHESTQ